MTGLHEDIVGEGFPPGTRWSWPNRIIRFMFVLLQKHTWGSVGCFMLSVARDVHERLVLGHVGDALHQGTLAVSIIHTVMIGGSERDVPTANFNLHSLHCKRNLERCSVCGEMVARTCADEHFNELHALVNFFPSTPPSPLCNLYLLYLYSHHASKDHSTGNFTPMGQLCSIQG